MLMFWMWKGLVSIWTDSILFSRGFEGISIFGSIWGIDQKTWVSWINGKLINNVTLTFSARIFLSSLSPNCLLHQLTLCVLSHIPYSLNLTSFSLLNTAPHSTQTLSWCPLPVTSILLLISLLWRFPSGSVFIYLILRQQQEKHYFAKKAHTDTEHTYFTFSK